MSALKSTKLKTLNLESRHSENKKANFFMKKGNSDVFAVTLACGLSIKATKDHPFLTQSGMIPLASIQGQAVAVKPFEGVLNDGSPERALILAKITGYAFGDGTLYFTGKPSKKKGFAGFYGTKEDLEKIRNDIQRLGFSSRVHSRTRDHVIKTRYGEKKFNATSHELHVTSTEFATMLKMLGVPQGNKTRSLYHVPRWIRNGSLSIKRQFLAGLFGAELSAPSTHTKTGFYSPILSMNKIEKLRTGARAFLLEVAQMLNGFNIRVSKITEEKDFFNKHGEKTKRFRLHISAEEDNLLKLWRTVGFEYNEKRAILAEIAVLYILLKKQDNIKRQKIAAEIKEYKSKGFRIGELKKLYSKAINERFVERHYYGTATQRISLGFASFKAFRDEKLKEYEQFGAIFDTIASIAYCGREEVYDFNVADNHNFIANGFIVSNCGVRLITTPWTEDEIRPRIKELLDELFRQIPSGVGRGGQIKLTKDQITELLAKGSQWALDNGYATKQDLAHTEEYGVLKGADPGAVSSTAFSRGKDQVGTLGAGNHFLELQKIGSVHNEKAATAFGINSKNKVVVMVHCGSRGLGHQVASDYIREMEDKFGYAHLPDRELVNAPYNSDLGQKYLGAMKAGMNFAFANRQLITHWIRHSFKKVMGSDEGMNLVYDVCHNGAKVEKHRVDGEMRTVCIHRKGATRAFGPGREEIPESYRSIGQPVLIPGSMGTASYVLVGTDEGEDVSFSSTAHGAGRAMSRTQALRQFRGEDIVKDMALQGITVKGASWKGVAEEAAEAYKDIDEVARVSDEAGIGKIVVRLLPLGVMKG